MPAADPKPDPAAPTPPPDGPEGRNSLADAAQEAAREIERRRDGSGGYAGEGDIG
jgi:hypothetical protein